MKQTTKDALSHCSQHRLPQEERGQRCDEVTHPGEGTKGAKTRSDATEEDRYTPGPVISFRPATDLLDRRCLDRGTGQRSWGTAVTGLGHTGAEIQLTDPQKCWATEEQGHRAEELKGGEGEAVPPTEERVDTMPTDGLHLSAGNTARAGCRGRPSAQQHQGCAHCGLLAPAVAPRCPRARLSLGGPAARRCP